ncbi:MAG TPA: hypothetical protein VGR89_03065 [Puia sp.]|nr:hypothetical protein [Puia sp.]
MFKTTGTGGMSNPSLAAETIVFTTPQMATGQAGLANPVSIEGTLYLTAGAGTTAIVLRLRQTGLITGPLVQALPAVTVVAASNYGLSFGFTDTSGFLDQLGGGGYVLTAQQTGGTGNGTSLGLDMAVSI